MPFVARFSPGDFRRLKSWTLLGAGVGVILGLYNNFVYSEEYRNRLDVDTKYLSRFPSLFDVACQLQDYRNVSSPIFLAIVMGLDNLAEMLVQLAEGTLPKQQRTRTRAFSVQRQLVANLSTFTDRCRERDARSLFQVQKLTEATRQRVRRYCADLTQALQHPKYN